MLILHDIKIAYYRLNYIYDIIITNFHMHCMSGIMKNKCVYIFRS